jgi:hypothetical protein
MAAWHAYELVDAGWVRLDGLDRMSIDEVDAAHHALAELRRARAIAERGRGDG